MAQVTRRQFAALAAGAGLQTASSQSRQPWNVVLVTNDQLRGDCVGASANPVIKTPNMDRLAAEGAYFEQHYVQCPQCVPSRSALHSGRYPHVNRTPTNLYRLPDTEQTLATVLKRMGYLSAAVGEMPFAPTKATGGFDIYSSDPEYRAFMKSRGWEEKAREHQKLLTTRFQAHPVPWPEEDDETAFFARRAIDFVRENRARPFFLHVNFRRPHHPFNPPAPYHRMYDGAAFPPSHRRDGEMANKPPAQQKAIENSVGFDLRTMTPADLDRVKSFYYGMVSENDKYIGEIVSALDQAGLSSRTIVIVTADHGEMLGDHGLLFKGGYFYDQVVHVPLIIRAPGKIEPGRRVKTLTEEIDVFPTVLELLGSQASESVQGRSLLTPKRREVHAEFPNAKMLRTSDWKLVHYLHAPYGELYNLRDDPQELYNLYGDLAYTKQKAEMKSQLADWLIDTQDPALPPIRA